MVHIFSHLANAARVTGILDLGAKGNFLKKGVRIATGKPSGKIVGMPNGAREKATQQVLIPTTNLNEEARLGSELPSLRNNLISFPILAANVYTAVFGSKYITRLT